MSEYSISQLERLTGIKAHTIRIWEKRYHLLKPERTDTNIRLYNNEELRRLLNISLLINNGYKISRIAAFSEKEVSGIINKMISDYKSTDIFSEAIINQLIKSCLAFNEIKFEKYFSTAIFRLGLKEAYVKIIYPLLVKLGMMWTTSELSPGQEHFITNLIRQKLYASIDSLPHPIAGERKWILFLPEEEDHETGLLFANFILKQEGHSVIYLGPRVPFESLKEAFLFNKPTDLLFFIVRHQPKTIIQKLIKNITNEFNKSTIYISGNKLSLKGIKRNENLHFITSVKQFYEIIK